MAGKSQGPVSVRYSPLPQQFAEPDEIFADLRELVKTGDFTLGQAVKEFERDFETTFDTKHAIGVGSGTDAIKIPLKALGVGHGDEVVTTANTFWATVGAIAELGARPVLVDCDDSFQIDVSRLEQALTERTRAIVPVHLTGDVADMPALMAIAEKRGLPVVEDACQSLMAELNGKRAGTFGAAAAFSMHPLKVINVWGDAGIVVTNDSRIDDHCRLLRNHGLRNRDEMEIFGFNSRLDSVQAIVGKWILRRIHDIVEKRIANAQLYDEGLRDCPGIRIPERKPNIKHVYLLYMIFAERRHDLFEYLSNRGIEAKVHYPIPLYQQKAMAPLGYKPGAFPVTDRHAHEIISLPVDQHLSSNEITFVIEAIREFYGV